MPSEQPQWYEDFPAIKEAMERAAEFMLAVHRGDVTEMSFPAYCPDGNPSPLIVDALWFHVDRILAEIQQIRDCITTTIDHVIKTYHLDQETVTEFVSPGPVQETWMSDLLISEDIKHKFVKEVAVLENVPDEDKDWHPGSNNQVLDLVHPSLHCCVFGQTKSVSPQTFTAGQTAVEHMQRMMFSASQLVENPYRGDANYQWIPSEFAVAKNGEVQIRSYINNLHPVDHRETYNSIADIFKSFVPMFDRALSCLLESQGPEPVIYYSERDDTNALPEHPPVPEILDLEPKGPEFSLRGRSVQVITKIAEIHLTPESPVYPGGAWHVEGSDAEQIVATGIYYFGCDNITESRLSFRVIVNEPEYEQNDDLGMYVMYGLARDKPLVQSLGSVVASEDRCVVFPNTLQHHVEPFELADKTRSGVRKILAFFVVDPSKRIPSTAEIPPQQADWVQRELDPVLHHLQHSKQVPADIMDKNIGESIGSVGMTLEEAMEHREELMEERQPIDADDDEGLTFSLCEH